MGMKAIFDGLYVDQLFQKNASGDTVFYPHGLMGRGYLVPADCEESVRRRMRLLMLTSLVVGVSFGLVALRLVTSSGVVAPAGWAIAGIAFVALIGAIVFVQSRLANGLAPVDAPRPSAGQWLRAGRAARAFWTHWTCVALGLFALLMAGAGLGFGIVEGDPWGFASGGFMLVVGAALIMDGVLGLIERSKGTPPQ